MPPVARFRSLLLLLLLASSVRLGWTSVAHAQRVAASVDSTVSVIDYTGSATLHDWTGTSRRVSGTLVIDVDAPGNSRVHLRAPVASFDSGIEARDENMREVTEADQFPFVSFRTTDIRPTIWGRSSDGRSGRWEVTGDLTFHGQTHQVEASVNVRVTTDSVRARTQFPVSLTRFGVERPGLVWGVAPVDDTIRIDARIAGERQARPVATNRLDTTRNEVTGTRRVESTDLRSLSSSQYVGSRAGLHTAVRRAEERREWIVSLYGFAEQPTGLAEAQEVALRADGQSMEPRRTTGSTRELDDGTIVEILEMQFSRSGYETLANALTASVSAGPASFPLSWKTRADLRLLLDRTPVTETKPVSSRDDN